MVGIFKGSKGGSGSFKQTPDNLRSNDTFEGVLGLCVGPISGPLRGLKSIKVDGTAIENETGDLNFQDFVANLGNGDPAAFPQTIQMKLGAGAEPEQVGLSLTNTAANTNPAAGPGPWLVHTTNNAGADFLDLRFIVSELYKQDHKGIYNESMSIEIQLKPVGSTNWIDPTSGTPTTRYSETGFTIGDALVRTFVPQSYFNPDGTWKFNGASGYQINGKTTSPTVYELRLAVPNEGPYANIKWDIRCRLVERDHFDNGDGDTELRTVSWESVAAVYGSTMGTAEGWRGVAWLQLYGKASDQLTGVPEITGEYNTKIVSVPPTTVFDPNSRAYTGQIWDGSWSQSFTTDPAWIINDAISDSLSGVSLVASGSYLNKWDALELSKWCSEQVPDGNGGTHCRYNLNIAISEPQKAEDFIRYLAGAVGALAWDNGNGEWRCKVDKPEHAVDIFTLENIEGEFSYSHTDVDTRFNDITFQFKNAEMDYRQDSVHIFDSVSIAQIGRKITTIPGVGCTNRQEALRRAMLRMRSTVNETRIVTFTTNRRGRNIEMLDCILVADGDIGPRSQRTTGRLVGVSADRKTLTFRDPMYLASGVAYSINYALPNTSYSPDRGSQPGDDDWKKPTLVVQKHVVSGPGTTTTITLDNPLEDSADENLVVSLIADNLPANPKLYRVTSVAVGDDNERMLIAAIEIDTGKWLASDNVDNSATVFQDLRGVVAPPVKPDGQQVLSVVKVPIVQGYQVNLHAAWQRPGSAFISGYRIQYSVNGGALQTAVARQQFTDWDLTNIGPGHYHVEISSIDRRGGYSAPLQADIEVTQALIEAAQIYYASNPDTPDQLGPSLEDLRPAEGGATAGAPNGTIVGDRNAERVVQSIDLNAENIIQSSLRGDALQALIDARTYLDGVDIGTVVKNVSVQQQTNDEAYAANFSLLGGKSGDNQSWVMDLSRVVDSNNQSLADKFSSISATSLSAASRVATLAQVYANPDGTAKASYTLTTQVMSNGKKVVSGFVNVVDNNQSSFDILANHFSIVDPNNGNPYTPFDVTNGVVKMHTVEVDTIKVGSGFSNGVPTFAQRTDNVNGNGPNNYSSVLSAPITLTNVGTIMVTTSASQSFPSGDKTWNARLVIDGSTVHSAGGDKTDDTFSLMGAVRRNAGTYTVSLDWAGDGSTHIASRGLMIWVIYG